MKLLKGDIDIHVYSQTSIYRSSLGQRKGGPISQVTS